MNKRRVILIKTIVIVVLVAIWAAIDILIWKNPFSGWTIAIPLFVSIVLAWMVKFKTKE